MDPITDRFYINVNYAYWDEYVRVMTLVSTIVLSWCAYYVYFRLWTNAHEFKLLYGIEWPSARKTTVEMIISFVVITTFFSLVFSVFVPEWPIGDIASVRLDEERSRAGAKRQQRIV